ncbi:MAG: glycoside hydrolase family 32 protein [Blastocatellia bacterium]
MLRCAVSLLLVVLLIAAADGQTPDDYYQEPFRPQFHFTPERNWMNDPNGLVYYQGEYHLFYQYNPFGNGWGHMSWGHAVSTDLLHWRHLPVTLAEENGVMIFSGSAVVDRDNTSGLCRNPDPKDKSCLIAIYTGHTETNQSQHIAVSNDRGRTWTKYAGNPVLDIGYKDFRDPKVIWHEATKKWVMVVSLSREQKVRFYGSPDLKKWELLSEFGGAGVAEKDVQWECPDLFELPVDGKTGKKKWVLIVNVNPGGVAGGSGGQYFIGSFDGRRFTNDNPPEHKMFLDYGKDFYAAVTFSDIPQSDGRRILLGWMSNWQYAGKEPTSPWRTAQSVPRVLSLKNFGDGLRLVQHPVAELQRLRDRHFEKPEQVSGDALEISAEFQTGAGRQPLIRLVSGPDAATIIGYDAATGRLFIDRSRSGLVDFDPHFPGIREAPIKLRQKRLKLRVLADRSSVEIFSADGQVAVTERIFPLNKIQTVQIVAAENQARCVAFDAWQLKSVWRK